MSNHLAIATVTETLRQRLEKAAREEIIDADVSAIRPKGEPGEGTKGIWIFLYHATPNLGLSNVDLPTRRTDGTVSERPQVALDLHYLLSFFGNENVLEPQRLLGTAVRFLHSEPLLTRKMIEDVVHSVDFLNESDLAYQVEKVKFFPLPLNLEELSKLWSIFFQTSYFLSVAYQASVVLIEAEEVPEQALPVRERGIYVKPFRHPQIEAITSLPPTNETEWADEPILVGHTLIITGKRLRGEVNRVRISGTDIEPTSVSDRQITFPLSSPPLPSEALRAGVQGLQIVHEFMMGIPQTPHSGVESELAVFVLRSTISVPESATTELDVTFTPKVGKTQRVVLLLNEFNLPGDRSPYAYLIKTPKDNGIEDPNIKETAAIMFPVTNVEPGDYLVRVQVDGAESPLKVENGQYSKPKVTIQ